MPHAYPFVIRGILVDSTVAEVHAEVWARLADAGMMIGMNDLWIAATALTHDLAY